MFYSMSFGRDLYFEHNRRAVVLSFLCSVLPAIVKVRSTFVITEYEDLLVVRSTEDRFKLCRSWISDN